ncbi:MAG: hemolysin family protein [Treponema sp.]|nr:hemolysin family protein [Treponema sp.]
MEDPLPIPHSALAPDLPLADDLLIAGGLLLASGFFSLFAQALRSARRPLLAKEWADAEKNAAAKRDGTEGRLRRGRDTAKAGKYRRVLRAVEAPAGHLAVCGFWTCLLRVLAVAGGLSGISGGWPFALCAAGVVLLVLALDHLASGLARHTPESIVGALLPSITVLGLPLRPFLFLARRAADLFRRAFPPKSPGGDRAEDALRLALLECEKSGVVESRERAMVEGVFYLGDRPIGVFMTHRSEVQWLDVGMPAAEVRAKVLEHRGQRCFPVADGTLDVIVGAAFPEDVILDTAEGRPFDLGRVTRPASFVPETMPALKAFEAFRAGGGNFLFVMDEYGGFAGMVSDRQLMEEIVGALAFSDPEEPPGVPGEDGSLSVAGSLNIDDVAEMLSLPELAASGDFHTLAGFLLSLAGELPKTGDSLAYRHYRFTVLEMDGHRIDRVGILRTGEGGGEGKTDP